jgi:hypothetical protein
MRWRLVGVRCRGWRWGRRRRKHRSCRTMGMREWRHTRSC